MWHNILNSITKDPVSLLASIGTLVAAIAALRTIRVMKRQMHSAYMPEIFVSADNTNRIVVLENDEDIQRRIACFYDTGGFQEKHGLRIILNNVGTGAAKNVKINWSFNQEAAVEKIEKALGGTIFKLHNAKGKALFIGDSSPGFLFQINLGGNTTSELDYVLPLKDGEFNFFPVVPTQITELHVLYFLCKSKLLTANDEWEIVNLRCMFDGFPTLDLQLSYEDIAGNRFDKFMKVEPFINRRFMTSENSEAGMRNELNLNFFMGFK